MIDQRFSVDAFARLRPDTREAEELSAALAHAIENVLHEAIVGALRGVVEQVRSLGHDLREVERRGHFNFTFGPGELSPEEGGLALFFNFFVGAAFLRSDGEGADEKAPPGPAPDQEVPF